MYKYVFLLLHACVLLIGIFRIPPEGVWRWRGFGLVYFPVMHATIDQSYASILSIRVGASARALRGPGMALRGQGKEQGQASLEESRRRRHMFSSFCYVSISPRGGGLFRFICIFILENRAVSPGGDSNMWPYWSYKLIDFGWPTDCFGTTRTKKNIVIRIRNTSLRTPPVKRAIELSLVLILIVSHQA